MPWMLDTNICIYIIKQKPISVFEKFKTIESGQIVLSAITVAELRYGVKKSVAVEKNLFALNRFLSAFDILPFNNEAGVFYGEVRAALERKGQPIGPLDTLIAAHALSLNCILVTNNEKEFSRIEGLQLENWTVS